VTVLDSSIATSSSVFAIHANSSSETLFLSGKDIESYLKKLETDATKVQEIDFQELAASAATPAPAAPAPATTTAPATAASATNTVQIAISAKKEEDFPTWYTDVNYIFLFCFCQEN